jgi:uncharacterized protein (DUF488 family)
LTYEGFLNLLRSASITAIADVRTAPYSRHFPHFNREAIRDQLRSDRIAYVFLGAELGGRPSTKDLYCNGVADYERMARTTTFKKGLLRLTEGANKFRIAMMCSEQDPGDCHRCLLIGRALHEQGIGVKHILPDRMLVDHADIERRLIEWAGRSERDFFESEEKQRAEAYRTQASKVAYSERPHDSPKPIAAE